MSDSASTINVLTKIFLVLLRIAIGWHFLYEGLHKLESFHEGSKPFSAEAYLRRSTGPFRDFFRSRLDNPDGLDRLDRKKLKNSWERYVEEFSDHYALTEEQQKQADAKLEELQQLADEFFDYGPNQEKIDDYKAVLADIAEGHARWNRPFQSQWLAEKQHEMEKLRAELVGKVDGWTNRLETDLDALLDETQHRLTAYRPAPTEAEQVSRTTAWALTIIGGCLVLGLFSRLSALAAAGFLAMIYLAMPPWPGLPPNPASEGFYMIVSKDAIELLAALVLATTHSGRWAGLDALVHALFVRPFSRKPD